MSRREAAPAAVQVAKGAAPGVLQRACACGQHTHGEGECESCRKGRLQRAAAGTAPAGVPPIVHEVLNSPGQPLDAGTRAQMEGGLAGSPVTSPGHLPARSAQNPTMVAPHDTSEQEAVRAEREFDGGKRGEVDNDVDFSSVRIHTGHRAALAARSLSARAFTLDNHIVFGDGHFRPATSDGRRLLAHELTHVLQQEATPSTQLVQRAPADAEDDEVPVGVTMTVSMDGLTLVPPPGTKLRPGRRSPQLLAIVLKRLIGQQYRKGLENEVETYLSKGTFERSGGFAQKANAKGGEPVNEIFFHAQPTRIVIDYLKTKKFDVHLTPAQEELINLGNVTFLLYPDFVARAHHKGRKVPPWYNKIIFDRELVQQAKHLRDYSAALEEVRKGKGEASAKGWEAVDSLLDALLGPAAAMEAIRLDTALAENPHTADIYATLWQVPPVKEGQARKLASPPVQIKEISTLVLFLAYMRTQQQLTDKIAEKESRTELVRRFQLFTRNRVLTGNVQAGDQQLRETPGTANYPPFPSTLTSLPALQPPLFEAPSGADYRFHMSVEFPSVYEALGSYAFNWERVRVPDDKIGQPVDVTKMRGEEVGTGEVASIRFGRATAYAKTDIERTVKEMTSDLGPFGTGALTLVGANAILRYLGEGIRMAFEILTMPRHQKLIAFTEPGLYMVRAAMSQVRSGDEAVVRPPSVAYYPVLARDPDEIAQGSVSRSVAAREQLNLRIKELESRLAQPDLKGDERKELEEELAQLKLSTQPLGDQLKRRQDELAERVKELKKTDQGGELAETEREQERIDKIAKLRAKRKVKDAVLLTARFVSDTGPGMPLTIEVMDRQAPKGSAKVYISDITTPKSGDATGSGPTREDAIEAALKDLLEGTHGYGRGRVAVALGGRIRTIRIDASRGSLLMEAVDNVATAISLAAVVAAPFTGGASLALLIPVGLVGAIPSAYRVYSRVQAGTFDLSLDNALEIVNIAGAAIGLGRLGATSLRMMRLGKGLMFIGFGLDGMSGMLMGAQVMQQIDELAKLPEGERAAALMMLIGQQMLSAGIQVGGALAERAHQMDAQRRALKGSGLADEAPPGQSKERPGAGSSSGVPSSSGADIVNKSRVDKEVGSLGSMDPASEAKLRANESLRKALLAEPAAAAALKKCNTPCFPENMTEAQVKRLGALLSRIEQTGAYDKAALKEYLHKRRDNLDAAITQIEGTKRAKDLNAWLTFFNDPKKSIDILPPRGDPKLLLEMRDLAYHTGEKNGRKAAEGDGLNDVGFENPFRNVGRYGQGFDDIRVKGGNLDTGEIHVVEYKGGDAILSEGQMSLDWVMGNIRRLHYEGGPQGQDWARVLTKALREGRLKGVVYSTPMDGKKPLATISSHLGYYPKTKLTLGGP